MFIQAFSICSSGGGSEPATSAGRETCKVCVLVPELVVRHWWQGLLHNRRSELLKAILLVRGNRRIVVVNIPWYLGKG